MIRQGMYRAALAVLSVVCAALPPGGAGASSRPRVRVQIYDLVHLSTRNIRLSSGEAGRLMRQVGVDVSWEFPLSEPPPPTVLKLNPTTPWQTENEEPALIVRILPLAPKVLPYALGYALAAEPDW